MKKKKVLVAFAMLLLTGVALSTASYAWFTANTSLTLGELDVNVQATNGIQVSLDATNWKSTLTTAEIKAAAYAGSTNQFPTTLSPVSTIGSTTAGIFDMYYGSLQEDGTITLTKETDTQGASTGRYVAFDIFVQATTPTQIALLNTSKVDAAEVEGATLSDKGLKYSARVGFLNKGTDATNTPATALALNGTVGQAIWEPNADQHTDNATGTTGIADGIIPSYTGAKAIGSKVAIGNITNFDSLAATLVTSKEDQITSFPNTTVVTVGAGITKVRIYVWVEGQDIDCENSASLGSGISVKINLNAK